MLFAALLLTTGFSACYDIGTWVADPANAAATTCDLTAVLTTEDCLTNMAALATVPFDTQLDTFTVGGPELLTVDFTDIPAAMTALATVSVQSSAKLTTITLTGLELLPALVTLNIGPDNDLLTTFVYTGTADPPALEAVGVDDCDSLIDLDLSFLSNAPVLVALGVLNNALLTSVTLPTPVSTSFGVLDVFDNPALTTIDLAPLAGTTIQNIKLTGNAFTNPLDINGLCGAVQGVPYVGPAVAFEFDLDTTVEVCSDCPGGVNPAFIIGTAVDNPFDRSLGVCPVAPTSAPTQPRQKDGFYAAIVVACVICVLCALGLICYADLTSGEIVNPVIQ